MARALSRAARALVGLALALAGPGAAQTVDVRLADEVTREPAAGAIVRLLRDGAPVALALTDIAGRVVLSAPGAGTYRLRADRIGYQGIETEPFTLAAGETVRRDLAMPGIRVNLPTIEVRAPSRCGRGRNDPLAVALWEEVQKALTANVLTLRAERVPVRVDEFERELNLGGRTGREYTVRSTITRGAPFVSVAPEVLAARGFVTTEGDSLVFSAPDAALLLSDAFVDTHCFGAVSRARDSLVGLTFEPVPGRTVPDVRGTLWVHRQSSELRTLEYGYVFPTGERQPLLGGRVEFTRLPAGAWIVSEWHIRMPRLRGRTVRAPSGERREEPYVVGYLERGGRARAISGEPQPAAPATALVTGTVRDSLRGRGLAGVTVRIAGATDSAVTGLNGNFRLAALQAGRLTVTAAHPLLLQTGAATSRDLTVSVGDSVAVTFATPAAATIARRLCGPSAGQGVAGLARDSAGSVVRGAAVRAVWRAADGTARSSDARQDTTGVFALCNLPQDRSVPVRVYDGLRILAEARARPEEGAFQWIELAAGEVPAAMPAGPAVIAGVVREDSTRRLLADVEVMVEGTTLQATTNAAGRYLITGAPANSRVMLRFRSIGYRPERQPVVLAAGDTTWASARLIPTAVVLPEVAVTAEAPRAPRGIGLEAFEERRAKGFGRFLDSTDLRRRELLRLGDVLATQTGIVIWRDPRTGMSARALSATRVDNEGNRCPMSVWLDGVQIYSPPGPPGTRGGGYSAEPPDLNTLLVHQIAAIEIYRSGADTPMEYGGTNAGCGTLILWTKRGI